MSPGGAITPVPDTYELQTMLRGQLSWIEIDSATDEGVPKVHSASTLMDELIERFKAYIEPQIPALLADAAKRGIAEPSAVRLNSAMRRYVLKQCRWLDSLEIAAGEARGDPTCNEEVSDEERKQIAETGTERRDVDKDIQWAADLLRVPARSFKVGRKPHRSLAERRA